ncbi:Peptidyl-prolyl cis-trans isomerase CWC27 like protein [Eufriesea mexicana]|nr:Peptidyl-prolyl cis-trans isomerase CWC27 like protein [Eufriesea mexicana]
MDQSEGLPNGHLADKLNRHERDSLGILAEVLRNHVGQKKMLSRNYKKRSGTSEVTSNGSLTFVRERQVVMKTTVGDVEFELWAKETPKACRYFIPLYLQNKHTIFGRVTGESIYSMLKLEEALVDENDEPLCPPRLMKTIILNNTFSDIIPRIIVQESEKVKDSSKTKTAAVNEEAEESEEESVILIKKFSGKDKSARDHLTDPKLRLQPAVASPELAN